MRWTVLAALFALVAASVADESDELPLAEPCDPEACQLPNCRCSTSDIPGGLAARDTPQFVVVTFDGGVNVQNILTYQDVLYNRRNANGCHIGTTFYVSHEYTNYRLVHELYTQGFEIALNSISRQANQEYWQYPSYEDMKQEFVDQRTQLSHFANIPIDHIKGVRKPYLVVGGNVTNQVMADHGLLYDCSWITINQINPGLWPYTLDYESTQDCQNQPCPTASIPGQWIFPMLSMVDPTGVFCGMADQCTSFQTTFSADTWYRFLLENFERQYLGNRAPFGIYIHEWYFTIHPAAKEAFQRFLDTVTQLEDVFVANSQDVIEWVQNPVPVNVYQQRTCRNVQYTFCAENTCPPLVFEDRTYYMTHCAACPNTYPWLGNPLGL